MHVLPEGADARAEQNDKKQSKRISRTLAGRAVVGTLGKVRAQKISYRGKESSSVVLQVRELFCRQTHEVQSATRACQWATREPVRVQNCAPPCWKLKPMIGRPVPLTGRNAIVPVQVPVEVPSREVAGRLSLFFSGGKMEAGSLAESKRQEVWAAWRMVPRPPLRRGCDVFHGHSGCSSAKCTARGWLGSEKRAQKYSSSSHRQVPVAPILGIAQASGHGAH